MTEADLDSALTRVFEARFSVGEFDDAALLPWSSISESELECQEHIDLAHRAARESIVLLKTTTRFFRSPKTRALPSSGRSATPSAWAVTAARRLK